MNEVVNFISFLTEKKEELESFALILARFSGIASFGPLTGNRMVAFPVRISIALAFSLPLYGLKIVGIIDNFFLNFLIQLLYGILLGWTSSQIFLVFQSGGRLVDDTRGMAQVALLDPSLSSSTTAGGLLFYLVASILFFKTGTYKLFLSAIYRTLYEPFTEVLTFSGIILIFRAFFTDTLLLCAPFFIVFLVTELLFGILNRSMPGLSVYFLLHQFKIFLGVYVLFVILYNLNELEKFFVDNFQKFLFLFSP